MHTAAPFRRLLTFTVFLICLLPMAVLFVAFAGTFLREGETTSQVLALWIQQPAMRWTIAICGLLLAYCMIRKQSAAALEFVMIPCLGFVTLASLDAFPLLPVPPASESQQPTRIVFDTKTKTEVWCNGVKLGETPFEITLDEFDERVAPAAEPPEQNATVYPRRNGFTFRGANWSAIPYDPHTFKFLDFGDTTDAIMSQLAEQKYWWSFRRGKYSAQGSRLLRSGNQDRQYPGVGEFSTLTAHANALKELARHGGVDVLEAYSDHIDQHIGLRAELNAKPVRQYDAASDSAPSDLTLDSSPVEIPFETAVWRQDWLWIARSNDPRSVPLLKMYFEQAANRYGHEPRSSLTFAGEQLKILMESPQPEIQEYTRERMKYADWTHPGLLNFFIDRQIEFGTSREELTEWAGQKKEALSHNFVSTMLRINGKNIGDYLNLSNSDFSSLQNAVGDKIPDSLTAYFAKRWRNNPSSDLIMFVNRYPLPDVLRDAFLATDLSTTQKAIDFRELLRGCSQSVPIRNAISEAATVAFKSATEQGHISALGDILAHVYTDEGRQALEAYSGPKNRTVESALKNVRAQLKTDRERKEKRLQRARDLIDGTLSPDDLVETKHFRWENGAYVLVNE